MNNPSTIIWVGLFTLIILGVFCAFLGKLVKKNKVVKQSESEIEWKKIQCPKCQITMECGYSMAGRGVIWRNRNEKKPGLFSTIFSTLDNTISINAPPALNISWYCRSCKLIVLDHSKMVKIKN